MILSVQFSIIPCLSLRACFNPFHNVNSTDCHLFEFFSFKGCMFHWGAEKKCTSKSCRKATATGVSCSNNSCASVDDLMKSIAGPVFFFTHMTMPSLKPPQTKANYTQISTKLHLDDAHNTSKKTKDCTVMLTLMIPAKPRKQTLDKLVKYFYDHWNDDDDDVMT